MAQPDASRTVIEVLRFEDLPAGALASRRAVVRFSDGTEAGRSAGTRTRSWSARAT